MIKENELAHDRKILANAEKVWGRAGEAGRRRLERRAKMVIDYCQLSAGKKVLEIGCGTGTLTEELAKTGATVVATDIFPEFLKAVESRIGVNQNVSYQIADAETLEVFADGSFDAVVGLSILHHLDIDKTLSNINRVLKPGGLMAFAEPNMLNPQIALQKNIPLLKKIMGDSPDETAFFRWPFVKKLKSANFSSNSVIPFDFLHPIIPNLLAGMVDELGLILERIPFIKEIAGSVFIGAKK
jgi:ubiquinone/menaquinone biosynthesis C-methylase UbiE